MNQLKILAENNKSTFIFDMDGTLLNEQHELSELTIRVLNELRARGANLVIATGRHLNDIRCYIDQLGGGIAAITCNGANIHDQHGELIYSQGLSLDINKLLIPLGNNFNVHVNTYTDTEWLINAACPAVLDAHIKSQFFYRIVNQQEMLVTPALKILFYGEEPELLKLKAQIAPDISNALNVTFSDENHLEIMQKDISKGDALKILLAKFNLPLNQTMAFGDSMNDVELFRTAAHPIMMENAGRSLQTLFPNAQRAQTNARDGVANFLLDYVL